MAGFHSGYRSSCSCSRSISGSSCMSRDIQKHEGRGQGLEISAQRQLPSSIRTQVRAFALLGATAGQGVVWYTGQFYACFFLIITLKLGLRIGLYLDRRIATIERRSSSSLAGSRQDRRLKIILTGCLIAAVTYFPLFQDSRITSTRRSRNTRRKNAIPSRRPTASSTSLWGPWSKFSDCDKAKDFPDQAGPVVQVGASGTRQAVVTTIGSTATKVATRKRWRR